MRLSSRGRYGLRALHRLALNWDSGTTLSLRDIAREEDLSETYLSQLFVLLRRAGLVESRRGVTGGYRLSRAPELIRMGEVLTALEGDVSVSCDRDVCMPASCGAAAAPCVPSKSSCATKDMLALLQSRINGVLDSVSLADMLREEAQR